jgi:tRNA pseudouridine55 synthase
MYSALRRHGKRLYELARAGIQVERDPRSVEVLSIEVLDWSPPVVDVLLTCGRGFYMRSLAYDLGRALGCGGHLKALVRLRSGPFDISEALSLGDMEQRFADGTWRESLYAPDHVVRHMQTFIVGRPLEETIRHGQPLPTGLRIPSSRPDEHCRVYGTDGRFIAMISFNASKGQWEPNRIFSLTYDQREG